MPEATDRVQELEVKLEEARQLLTDLMRNHDGKKPMEWLKANYPDNCLSCGAKRGDDDNYCGKCGRHRMPECWS